MPGHNGAPPSRRLTRCHRIQSQASQARAAAPPTGRRDASRSAGETPAFRTSKAVQARPYGALASRRLMWRRPTPPPFCLRPCSSIREDVWCCGRSHSFCMFVRRGNIQTALTGWGRTFVLRNRSFEGLTPAASRPASVVLSWLPSELPRRSSDRWVDINRGCPEAERGSAGSNRSFAGRTPGGHACTSRTPRVTFCSFRCSHASIPDLAISVAGEGDRKLQERGSDRSSREVHRTTLASGQNPIDIGGNPGPSPTNDD